MLTSKSTETIHTAAQLKSNMLMFLNKNSDYFTVSCIIVIKLYVITATNITSIAMVPKLYSHFRFY